MKIFAKMKDGGPESRVWGYWLIEWKRFFSVVLLHFKDGSREAYHSHAFNAKSWVLKGKLTEHPIELNQRTMAFEERPINVYLPNWRPIWTPRQMMHKVESAGDTWVLSFRGPWAGHWQEYIPAEKRWVILGEGRRTIADIIAAEDVDIVAKN